MPIQVAVNKAKLLVWSPSLRDANEQTQLEPFTYQLADLNGDPLAVAVGKGKIVFISYWATWCPPCVAELPSIEKLHATYGDQIDFMLITNEEAEVVTRFLEKHEFVMPVYNPQMAPPLELYDTNIPTNYLLDRDGKIIIKETGAADWNSAKVRSILENMLTE